MYKDINKVLENIRAHFEVSFSEKFGVDRQFRYVDFISENYKFRVRAAFIQARIAEDFEVPIQQRIDEVLKAVSIEKGVIYNFSTKFVDEPLPTKYCVELVE
ncbi:hypothetical protein NB554_24095 [Vibrio alginolyticus]|uniref:hypothetical protein n=1 Tax=Vibrio alginolyticus TaxID=663 RepID=UPI00215BF8AB|nr:hypothetical protein [Vibrio alginolyticus]MCR9886911.1 hypothetical protein [Vibrio alginolyticus]